MDLQRDSENYSNYLLIQVKWEKSIFVLILLGIEPRPLRKKPWQSDVSLFKRLNLSHTKKKKIKSRKYYHLGEWKKMKK